MRGLDKSRLQLLMEQGFRIIGQIRPGHSFVPVIRRGEDGFMVWNLCEQKITLTAETPGRAIAVAIMKSDALQRSASISGVALLDYHTCAGVDLGWDEWDLLATGFRLEEAASELERFLRERDQFNGWYPDFMRDIDLPWAERFLIGGEPDRVEPEVTDEEIEQRFGHFITTWGTAFPKGVQAEYKDLRRRRRAGEFTNEGYEDRRNWVAHWEEVHGPDGVWDRDADYFRPREEVVEWVLDERRDERRERLQKEIAQTADQFIADVLKPPASGTN